MRKEDVRRIILKTFRRSECHGYEVHKKLAYQGVNVEISRLYRFLNEMLKEGYLESSWTKSDVGPKRRTYRLGRKGREEFDRILIEGIRIVHDYYQEYLLSLPPEANVFERICRPLTNHLKGEGSIVYLSPIYSVMHQQMLETLHSRIRPSKIYFVRPRSMVVELPTHLLVLGTLDLLDGTYDRIPLRDGFADLLLVMGIPPKDCLEAAIREWHRVLKRSGMLVLLTPTVLLHGEDPLTTGDFMEKYEHEILEGSKPVDKEFVEMSLRDFFQEVEERHIVHMTILQASNRHDKGTESKK